MTETAAQTDTTQTDAGQSNTTDLSGDWRTHVPQDVQEWDEFKNSDSAEKFYGQMANHRKLLGSSVRIPGEDAGDEQMTEFYAKIQNKVPGLMRTPDMTNEEQFMDTMAKLGMPDNVDDYSVSEVENYTPDAEQLGMMRALAKEAGLTKGQFQKFTAGLMQADAKIKLGATEGMAESVAGLRGEWGSAFDQRSQIAAKVAEQTGAPKGLVEALSAGQADGETMKWLFGLSQKLGGEKMNFGPSETMVATPLDLETQIAEMMGNNDHPYWDDKHPGHGLAVKKMQSLREKLIATR